MGKPFKHEIQSAIQTIAWTLTQDLRDMAADLFRHRDVPVFIVGSGGSLSACYMAAYLYQSLGVVAKAITPFDLFYALPAMKNVKILFISASGKNSDILFAFNTAIKTEPISLLSICMKKNTKLKELASSYSSTAKVYELTLPSGKDGFLATNSLIGYFGILLKSFGHNYLAEQFEIPTAFHAGLKKFISKIDKSFSFMVLYGGCAQPVAMDIESKFIEAALGDVSVSDYRNFAHGRHHWFAKRGATSCIIALITEGEEKLAEKTLSLLPKSIPVMRIESKLTDPVASLDLLHKAFYLVQIIGEIQKIDPGRPGVPDYGSKLYNLKYAAKLKKTSDVVETIILRKANCKSVNYLCDSEYLYWKKAYQATRLKYDETVFGAIIFDYDGTLCSFEDRFNALTIEVVNNILKILEGGIVLGIATGRGKSVRQELQKAIPQRYWKNVIVGYYNGSDIAFLSDDTKPLTGPCNDPTLVKLHSLFESSSFTLKFNTELRPFQLTIEVQDTKNWNRIKPLVLQQVKSLTPVGVELLESTHSIDIVKKPECSKLNLLPICKKLIRTGRSENVLCVGDKGQWPGNDYELLAHQYSLSVNEVSSDPESCWNFASPGVKNVNALIEYFSLMTIDKTGLRIKFQ